MVRLRDIQPFERDGIVLGLKKGLPGHLFESGAKRGQGVCRQIDSGDLFKEWEEFGEHEGTGRHCRTGLRKGIQSGVSGQTV
ncbi:hypothetical protein GKA01_16970 [Gluconobacter kanchanaburiensis NBRC 103587]|uniref:Uncharacterized protein n=1 Tax=Gluconobacter kanchanaburiensis NBRC 103587 TaxID=1307948 RepID=A0A511B7S2_9PROT|nr:hypothetical protein AA103587_2404 [Gluconobacter kanchanaburiensis NBRC 103587]GEK96500.1 hypothetical protein GKA01_16970 [Gluconobacter kanchanaburiensis NBRC 103587]